MQLPTQQQFVDNCLAKYWFTDIPSDQKWEEAHFPLPECLGEGDTVMLWSADHTVQGLLQSVELDHQCFHGYRNEHDTNLLTIYYPQYLELFAQLKSQFSRRKGKIGGEIGGKIGGPKAAAINKANGTGAFFNPELHSAASKKGGEKSGAQHAENKTGICGQSAEQMTANGKKGGEKSGAQKWQCSVTSHISTAAGLSHYQKARRIDTKLRVKIN